MTKKLKMIIVVSISIALIISYVFFGKNNIEKFRDDLAQNSETEIMKDLLVKRKFSPPYKDIAPLVNLAKSCKTNVFDEYPMEAEYSRIGAKQEILGTATSNTSTVLKDFIRKSGGVTALSDYISPDLIYIYNVQNRSSNQAGKSADKIYAEFEKSPQVKKAQKWMEKFMKAKDSNGEGQKKALAITNMIKVCNIIDLYYTALGGVEYSNSADIYPSVKRALHRGTMSSLSRSLNSFSSSVNSLMNSN